MFDAGLYVLVVAVDRVDTDGSAHNGPFVRLPFALLFDTFGTYVSAFFFNNADSDMFNVHVFSFMHSGV